MFAPRIGIFLDQTGGGKQLLSRLDAYWTMNEASGSRADSSGHGNTLLDTNSVGAAAGKISNAASFLIASSQYLSCASSASLQTSNTRSFTIAGWIQSNNTLNGKGVLNKASEYAISVAATTGQLNCSVAGSGVVSWTASSLSDGSFHFIVFKWDASIATMSINVDNSGTPVTGGFGGSWSGTANDLNVGINTPPTTNRYEGLIDELGKWSYAWSAADETFMYNSGSGRTYPFS